MTFFIQLIKALPVLLSFAWELKKINEKIKDDRSSTVK